MSLSCPLQQFVLALLGLGEYPRMLELPNIKAAGVQGGPPQGPDTRNWHPFPWFCCGGDRSMVRCVVSSAQRIGD